MHFRPTFIGFRTIEFAEDEFNVAKLNTFDLEFFPKTDLISNSLIASLYFFYNLTSMTKENRQVLMKKIATLRSKMIDLSISCYF